MKKLIIFIMMMISLIFSACGVNNLEESSAELIYAEQEQKTKSFSARKSSLQVLSLKQQK